MIFIDSNVLIAYFNERDKNHNLAIKIISNIDKGKYDKPVISDYIFSEIVTVTLLKKKEKKIAIEAGKEILKSKIKIIKVNKEIFNKAWQLFQEYDLKMSFTDFTNLAILELLSINQIATFDRDFKKIKNIGLINE